MRRFAFALACCGQLMSGGFAGPAAAGEVWYSASCCYEKIVRHETRTYYAPVYRGYARRYAIHPYDPYYDDRPNDRLFRDVWDADNPRRFYRRYRYDGYRRYSSELCYWRRTRTADTYTGRVWGRERVCY